MSISNVELQSFYHITHFMFWLQETRRSIRLLLLQSFGSMCALDSCIVSELLNSVLPLELARDIQNDQTGRLFCNCFPIVCWPVLSDFCCLTMSQWMYVVVDCLTNRTFPCILLAIFGYTCIYLLAETLYMQKKVLSVALKTVLWKKLPMQLWPVFVENTYIHQFKI